MEPRFSSSGVIQRVIRRYEARLEAMLSPEQVRYSVAQKQIRDGKMSISMQLKCVAV